MNLYKRIILYIRSFLILLRLNRLKNHLRFYNKKESLKILCGTYLERKEERLSEEAIENYIGASFIIVIWQWLSLSIH